MNLLRDAATVGGMTMVSRVLGFARDALIASLLGTGPAADAFVVAFRFPNLFRRFFAEGAFNSAFVPLYAKRLEGEGRQNAHVFASEAFSGLISVLLIFTLIALLAMPWIMVGMAGGFLLVEGESFELGLILSRLGNPDGREKYDLAVDFTRIALPYLLFVSLVALLSGILNSLGRFFLSAAAPILLNIILVAVLVFIAPYTAEPGRALVWGVFVGGAVQFAALAWGCMRIGVMPSLRMPRLTPNMKRLIVLGVPGIIAAGITQINLVIGTFIASFEQSAVAILFYADRLYQLPLGLVGVAMGVVLLPDLSRRLRAGDEASAITSQNRAIEISLLLTLPAAFALIVIPVPVISALFEHGEFTSSDTRNTAAALAVFACGLPAFVLIKVFSPGFFAREDTRTPMIFAAINAFVNITLSVVLFFRIGLVGIAIGTSTAAWVNTILLASRLWQLGHFVPDRRVRSRLPRILLASIAMAAVLWALTGELQSLLDGTKWQRIGALGVLVTIGGFVFAVFVQLAGGARISELIDALRGDKTQSS